MLKQIFFKDISIFTNEGSIEGYICDLDDVNWRFFLLDLLPKEDFELLESLFNKESVHRKICVLKNLYVDPTKRNEGIGTSLLEEFLETAYEESDFVILESDSLEDNNFDLNEWYTGYGFTTVKTNLSSNPVMFLKTKDN